ncbi:MAG: zinc finger domain-containing protein [Arenimonas sp.]
MTKADIDVALPSDGQYRAASLKLNGSGVLALREAVSKVLEPMRADGKIGASLQAEVDIYGDFDAFDSAGREELRFLFITSTLELRPSGEKPADAIKGEGVDAWIVARPSAHGKCVRCWHYRADVGAHGDDPELCGRCVENVNGGGEVRRYF